MELHLTADEQAVLEELLLDAQRRLFLEISKTDHLEFRRMLRKRESILETLLAGVATTKAPVGAVARPERLGPPRVAR